jgi:DNA-binding transcriptional LysR family regulator
MGQYLDLEALADFLAAIDAGGVTAAARQRRQPKQTVSRRLLALEAELGVRLFDRTTRALRLTPEGALLQERARRVLADVEETRRTLADRSAAVEGLLRISAPVLLGQTVLGRVAARILAAYPNLRLEIVLSDRRVDLIEEGYDAAIRVGQHDDSSLVSRVFANADTIVVASPTALAAWGAPARPEDLARKPCILFADAGAATTWTLSDGERSRAVKITGRLTCTSLKLCLDAAVAGAGFASIPAFLARPSLDSGEVRGVLPGWISGRAPLRIVYPSKRLLSARLRAFIDETVASFAGFEF